MASKFKEPEISPSQALANIESRLHDAVEAGKKKAGVASKTEAVLEGATDSGDEYGDDLDFSELSGHPVSAEREELQKQRPDDEYGDNLSLDMLDDKVETPSAENNDTPESPTKSKRQERKLEEPKPVTVTKRPEDIGSRANEDYTGQFKSQWTFSVEEMSARLKTLFQYAAENRAYLTDAGPMITEPEMMAIFFAEYRNYIAGEHKGATDAVINAIPEIIKGKSQWFLAQFNERLHGIGNFLENGSIMRYLMRIGHQQYTRNAQMSDEALAPGGEEGLCNFIMARDLQSCERFVDTRTRGVDVPKSAKTGLALDILVNGINKPDILNKIGGIGSKMYSTPRFGSIERRGDDICIVGSQSFLNDFLVRFNSFIKTLDKEPEGLSVIEPAIGKSGKELGHGLNMVRYPEVPYLGILNDAVSGGVFVPIKFNSGTVSLTGGGSGEGAEGESRYSDILQTHQSDDYSHAVDYSVGERLSANNLMAIMDKPGFAKLVERYGVKDLSDDAKASDGAASTVKLSKLVANLLMKIAERNGVTGTVETKHGISVAKLGTNKSLAKMASDNEGISSQEKTAIVAVLGYNNAMMSRVNSMKGNDISDLGGMNETELKKTAIPIIHVSKLGEQCLNGGYDDPNAVAFAKGYLINALGSAVGFAGSDGQIFGSAADFAKTTNSQKVNADIIKREIASLDVRSLPAYAQLFEEKAEDHIGHAGDDEPEGGWFYDSRKMVTLDKVGKSTIARAIEFINPGVNGAEVVMGAVETVSGLEKGYLAKYMEALMKGDAAGVASMAGAIVNSKGDVISVKLSNTAAETVKRDTSAKDKAAARRKARRGTWFD